MLALFCGSRDYTNYRGVDRALDCLRNVDSEVTVLHGGARGPDTFAQVAAVKSSCKHIAVHPDWHRFGKQAGFLRNAQMLEMNPDIVLAFWDGHSRGTRHTIDLAINRYRIPVVIYYS